MPCLALKLHSPQTNKQTDRKVMLCVSELILLMQVLKLWTDGSDSLGSEQKPKDGVDSKHMQVLLACS